MRVCEFANNFIFWTFYSIDDGREFIIVFEAGNPVVDNRDNFHRNSIE